MPVCHSRVGNRHPKESQPKEGPALPSVLTHIVVPSIHNSPACLTTAQRCHVSRLDLDGNRQWRQGPNRSIHRLAPKLPLLSLRPD
ncbi:hypothetical protein ACOMHN_031573 [Nucella lapillus]